MDWHPEAWTAQAGPYLASIALVNYVYRWCVLDRSKRQRDRDGEYFHLVGEGRETTLDAAKVAAEAAIRRG